jgi:hypothetical protein
VIFRLGGLEVTSIKPALMSFSAIAGGT